MTVELTLPALQSAYVSGVTPAQIIDQVFTRIAQVDDPAMFVTLRDPADVLADATALGSYDPAKPLWGVPFAVKDNIDVGGLPTTAACPAYAYTPEDDAFVVAQLKAAGALVIGKTNLDQFATGLVGVRSPYGIPKNAIDPEIVPGGSSAGSAVAVAQGVVAFALGTDTAGSGRVPAAFNNIVGLKPSLGSWSARGSVPACRSVETISVFALTVEDAYSVFQVGCRYDPEDAFAKNIAAPDLSAAPRRPRIAVPSNDSRKFFGDDVQAASFDNSLDILATSGAEIVEIDFQPFYDVAQMLYEGAWVAERYTVIETLLRDTPDAVHPVTAKIVRAAESLSAADAFRGIYRLKELQRVAEASLDGIDLLCVPSIPTFYTCDDLDADPVTPNSNLGTYTNFVNLMDMCALAVPTPTRSDGRPGSVTLIALSGQDALLASLAEALEMAGSRTLGATGWARPARSALAPAPSGLTPIVVCGAHMSGLPLNGDLTRLGAQLDSKTETSAEYRFYALAGGPPARPGLVRNSDGGASIEVEVWSVPTEMLGAFIATIPSPLGLGQVRLADGTAEIGFLCEAAGLDGAEDITELGSWRAYLRRQAASQSAS